MLKTGMAQLILISALTGAMCSTHQRSIQVPTGRDAISADEQAEKLSKAAEKRARKAAKRAKK